MVYGDYHRRNFALSPSVIARYCQVSKGTVLRWIRDSKLQAFRLPSGHYRVDKTDFRDFLERWNMPIKEWLFESETRCARRSTTIVTHEAKRQPWVAKEGIPDLEAKLLASLPPLWEANVSYLGLPAPAGLLCKD